MARRHSQGKYDSQSLRAVSIARTVQEPQAEFEEFLKNTGRVLGRRGSIRAITSTRMTFLESRDAKRAMRLGKATPQQSLQFSYWLGNRLNVSRSKDLEVTVDDEEPLKIMGNDYDKLVLRVYADQDVVNARNRAEALLAERFGELPEMRSFEPHITLGYIGLSHLTEEQIANPSILLPPEIIPKQVVLNGLSIYLDGNLHLGNY